MSDPNPKPDLALEAALSKLRGAADHFVAASGELPPGTLKKAARIWSAKRLAKVVDPIVEVAMAAEELIETLQPVRERQDEAAAHRHRRWVERQAEEAGQRPKPEPAENPPAAEPTAPTPPEPEPGPPLRARVARPEPPPEGPRTDV